MIRDRLSRLTGARSSDVRDLYRTYRASGIAWRARHELSRRLGLYGRLRSVAPAPSGWRPLTVNGELLRRFYDENPAIQADLVARSDQVLAGRYPFFSGGAHDVGWPPAWLRHVRTGAQWTADRPWTETSTDDLASGDIKWIWEPSRFGFAWLFARTYLATGDERYSEAFWRGFDDWLRVNPPFLGPNWYCGQETALRLIAVHFAVSVFAAATGRVASERQRQVEQLFHDSARRIEQALHHALSQRNNHALSELIGLWTVAVACPRWPESPAWRRQAERGLEHTLADQFAEDGAYIQESFNYHRVAVHLLSWARWLARSFSVALPRAVDSASRRSHEFLLTFVDRESGQLPNYGANDGALVLPLSTCGFRDYRPLLQQLAVHHHREPAFGPGPWDEERCWLGAAASMFEQGQETVTGEDDLTTTPSGYIASRRDRRMVFLRAPHHAHHRPSQADALHLDLWLAGRDVACDPGTFAYTGAAPWNNGLTATRVHNTVSVGDRDQMKRRGRFLWLRWSDARIHITHSGPRGDLILADVIAEWTGTYRHTRLVAHTDQALWILDAVDRTEDDTTGRQDPHGHDPGHPDAIRVHWNLEGTDWARDAHGAWRSRGVLFQLRGHTPGQERVWRGDQDSALGWISPTYGEKIAGTAIELESRHAPVRFATEFRWRGAPGAGLSDTLWHTWCRGDYRACAAGWPDASS